MIYDMTIISLIIRVIEGFAQVYLLNSIMHKDIRKRDYIISVMLIVMLYEIVSRIIPASYNYKFVTTFLIIVPVVSCVCKIKMNKVFFGYAVAILIIALLDLFAGIILLHLLDIEKFYEISLKNP